MKAGDKVTCVRGAGGLLQGGTFTVRRVGIEYVHLEEVTGGWFHNRFRPVLFQAKGKPDSQLNRVRAYVAGRGVHTLAQIANGVKGASEAAISARLRDLRKEGYTVEVVKQIGTEQRLYKVSWVPGTAIEATVA